MATPRPRRGNYSLGGSRGLAAQHRRTRHCSQRPTAYPHTSLPLPGTAERSRSAATILQTCCPCIAETVRSAVIQYGQEEYRTTPLLELEGTWAEITAQILDFAGQKLRVLVYPVEENSTAAPDTRPMAEVLADIAATIPPSELAKLPPDFTDQLDHYVYGTPKR